MLKSLFGFIKKIILAVLFIYSFNKMAFPLSLFIPINVVTMFLVTILGIPAILMLILFSLLIV